MGMPYAVLMPIFADKILGGRFHTLGLFNGRERNGRIDRRVGFGFAQRSFRTRTMGCNRFRRFGNEFDFIFVFQCFLAFDAAFDSRRIFDDDADVFVKHIDSGNGAGRIARARDERLFDDVYGNGSARRIDGRFACRNYLGAQNTVALGGAVCIIGSILFSMRSAEITRRGKKNDRFNADDGGSSGIKSEFPASGFKFRK